MIPRTTSGPVSARLRGPSNVSGPRVVAIGGGHGLSATLRALRRVSEDVTAVVAVSDDGGSSGRLRRDFDVLPPGDLRMALAALCGDDAWGRTWSRVVQHRFAGAGDLSGHALGNLLITALWEETGDIVDGLDWVAALLGAHGRVLPVATQGLDVCARIVGHDPADPEAVEEIRGQVAVATCGGRVLELWLEPPNIPACPQAVDAISTADVVVLGPGSWYTSVLAPLLVPGIGPAVSEHPGRVIVVLNVGSGDGETSGLTRAEHLQVLAEHMPKLRVDIVLADSDVAHPAALTEAAAALGATVIRAPLAATDGSPSHDVDLLAAAFSATLSR